MRATWCSFLILAASSLAMASSSWEERLLVSSCITGLVSSSASALYVALTRATFLTSFARDAKRSVERVSVMSLSAGETHTTSVVFALPPSESLRMRVSTCAPVHARVSGVGEWECDEACERLRLRARGRRTLATSDAGR